MSRRTWIVLGGLIAIALSTLLIWRALDGGAPAGEPRAQIDSDGAPTPATPKRVSSGSEQPATSFEPSPDDDPVGDLRLEGQVLDADDLPVAGATVYLDSNPPRQTTTEDDGSFFFDKLVGRTYVLNARSDRHVGGPAIYKLTADSDPVVIRVTAGATLEVTVVSASSGAPISGAAISLVGLDDVSARTDRAGVATIHNVPSDDHILVASADGYAQERQFILVPATADSVVRQHIALRPGYAVSGRVVDSQGAPVAGAHVIASDVSAVFDFANPKRDGVTSDEKGAFQLPATAEGSYRLLAVHSDYAPAATEPMTVTSAGLHDVVITMEPGGTIAGRVVDSAGAPVPWAAVAVNADPDAATLWGDGRSGRSAMADETGAFRITGLARRALVVHASSDAASSEIVKLDLASTPTRENLTLTLSVEGVIAGVVVDETGEPVTEAQVMAHPDIWGGGDVGELAVRGGTFAQTDGGGHFKLRGLPDGAFRVRASRGKPQGLAALDRGVAARTGDTNVRVVLPARGAIEGKVLLSDGRAPELATVAVAWASGVPAQAKTGEFRVADLPPGTYEVTVRGPDFPQKIVSDVVIEPGKTTDLGTITVERGRVAKGRVIDAAGKPVAGATVVLGTQIMSDGDSLTAKGFGSVLDDQLGLRRATTDDRGGFRISGIAEDKLAIVAEHAERGRSAAAIIPAGKDDSTVELRLAPFGGLRGKVTINGEPAPGLSVIVGPPSGAAHMVIARTGADGSYAVDKVAAGDYKVTVIAGGGAGASMAAKPATIQPGKVAVVDVDLVEGKLTLVVTVAPEGDGVINAAQVFLFEGNASPRTGGEINELFLNATSGDGSGTAKMSFSFGGKPASFTKITPGNYSVCVIPITGDMNDPTFAQKLQRNADKLAVHCRKAAVAESPDEQTFTATVPAMAPLPEG